MVNRFVLNGISYHGKGAVQEIPEIIKGKGLNKAFIASDPDLVKFGVTKKVTDLLDESLRKKTWIFWLSQHMRMHAVQETRKRLLWKI